MTRSDLVEELAARYAQLTHRDAELAVKTVLDAMSDALVRGHRIEIRGFGSFRSTAAHPASVAIRARAKALRSLKNGCPISNPAKPCVRL
jgi:nucleoid DNA-binding protein